MPFKKSDVYAAYSTRQVITGYDSLVFSYVDDLGFRKSLPFGSNKWLSDREVGTANPYSSVSKSICWYDQVSNNDLVVGSSQSSPLLSTKNYQRLVNHKPTLTFTDGLGLTATNPVTDFRDVCVSFVVAINYVSSSTLFNFTDETTKRFQSHLPWGDNTIYFDYGNYTTDTNWRISAPNPVPTGKFAVVTYIVSEDGAKLLVNGSLLASGSPTESETPKDKHFVLGAANGVSAGGHFSVGEVIISKASLAPAVIKSQLKYFNIS
jgi:hypothetical protein